MYRNDGDFHPFCSQIDAHHSQTVDTVEAKEEKEE
jgi:hypothetical protein